MSPALAHATRLPLLLVACTLVGGVAAAPSSLQDVGDALAAPLPEVVVYTAKEVVTMDPRRPTATAVAVVDGRILAVGTVDDLRRDAGTQPVRIDTTFADKVLVPGLIAQHTHPVLAALTMRSEIISIEDWVLPTRTVPAVRDRAGYLARLAAADRALTDPGAPLFTWGFHQYFHGKLTRADLDAINAKRPIIVWHRSAHEFIVNSAALAKYGITADYIAKQSPGAQQTMSLAEGHFWEQGMFPVMPLLAPAVATPERLRDGLLFLRTYMHANGVTAGAEPGGVVSRPLQDAQNAVLGSPDNPFRFYYIVDGKTMGEKFADGDMIGETEKLYGWGSGNTAYLRGQAKLFADGAIFSQDMQLRDGYLDGHSGEWMMEPALFAKVFRKYWDAGFQIHIHQNGDAALDMVLANLEDNLRRHPRYDHRTTVVHFGFSGKDQVDRIRRLGAIVSGNPYYVMALADRYGEVGIGPQRSNEMVRMGDVERAGIHYSFHDDMPMAPSQPLFLMHVAVNRTTFSGRVAGPDQRVSREGALRAVTIEAAHSLRLENEIGSIEPGKRANFTVLAENPVTVAPGRIKDIAVWGTVHEGRVWPVARTAGSPRAALGPVERWSPRSPAEALAAGGDHDHAGHDDACTFGQRLVAALERAAPGR